MKSNSTHRSFLALLASLLLASISVRADENPPERLPYQGFLTDGNGVALATNAPKNYDIVFRIYGSQSGNDLKWSEQQTVTVDKGYFSMLLGEGSQVGSEPRGPLSALFTGADASDRFVGITVKGVGTGTPPGDVDIMPRLRMMTSPYAFLARRAVNASSLANSSNQVMTVSGNNIGINNTLPNTTLDVNGAGTFTGNVKAGTAFIGDVGLGTNWAGFAHKNAVGSTTYGLIHSASGQQTFLNAKSGTGSIVGIRYDNNTNAVAAFDSSGNATITGGMNLGTATGALGTGQIRVAGSTGGYYFKDRTQANEWALYATSGYSALWNGADKFSVETTGKVNVYSNSPVEFGYGVSKGQDNGKIGYKTFSDGLDIVGAGTTQGNRKVQVHGNLAVTGNVSSPKFNVTEVMANWKGNWHARATTFTSQGGTLVFTMNVTGWGGANTHQCALLYLDGIQIGSTCLYFNAAVHMAFPANQFIVRNYPAGTHSVQLWGNGVSIDANDYSSLTVMELPF